MSRLTAGTGSLESSYKLSIGLMYYQFDEDPILDEENLKGQQSICTKHFGQEIMKHTSTWRIYIVTVRECKWMKPAHSDSIKAVRSMETSLACIQ